MRDEDQQSARSASMRRRAIREFVSRGAPAEIIADRVLEAIRTDRFYILSGEEDGWRQACNARLENIRLGRNPSFVTPAA